MSLRIPDNRLERLRFAAECDEYLEGLSAGFQERLSYREAAEKYGLATLIGMTVRVTWFEPRPVGGRADAVRITAPFGEILQEIRRQGHVPFEIITAIEIPSAALVNALAVAAML